MAASTPAGRLGGVLAESCAPGGCRDSGWSDLAIFALVLGAALVVMVLLIGAAWAADRRWSRDRHEG